VPISCFVAHDAAYYDVKILHHDISVENIMILKGGGEGFLIDWNMCACIEEEVEPLERVERTVRICLLFQDCFVVDISLIL